MILLANKHTPRSSTFLKPLQLIGLTDSAQLTPKLFAKQLPVNPVAGHPFDSATLR
jgi:hypothetical protein